MIPQTTASLDRPNKPNAVMGSQAEAILERMNIHYDTALEREMAPLYTRVQSVIPPIEWPFFAPYIKAINQLKREKNAVILAHNYQTPEIFHCIADVVGDSLQLAREAAKTKGDIIIQCGVHFMAETSKLLNPDKKVLIPDMKAGCSLAESINGAADRPVPRDIWTIVEAKLTDPENADKMQHSRIRIRGVFSVCAIS